LRKTNIIIVVKITETCWPWYISCLSD